MAETETDRRTVVVKGVKYDWTSAELENAFSDIGPIRKCFLVTEKGSSRHKVCLRKPSLVS